VGADTGSGRIWNPLATYKMVAPLKSVALFGRTSRTCLRSALDWIILCYSMLSLSTECECELQIHYYCILIIYIIQTNA